MSKNSGIHWLHLQKQVIQYPKTTVWSKRQEGKKREKSEYTSSSASNQGRKCHFNHEVSQP